MALPAFTIHQTVAIASKRVFKNTLNPRVKAWGPTLSGLAVSVTACESTLCSTHYLQFPGRPLLALPLRQARRTRRRLCIREDRAPTGGEPRCRRKGQQEGRRCCSSCQGRAIAQRPLRNQGMCRT
jgi:hypothetical protein